MKSSLYTKSPLYTPQTLTGWNTILTRPCTLWVKLYIKLLLLHFFNQIALLTWSKSPSRSTQVKLSRYSLTLKEDRAPSAGHIFPPSMVNFSQRPHWANKPNRRLYKRNYGVLLGRTNQCFPPNIHTNSNRAEIVLAVSCKCQLCVFYFILCEMSLVDLALW